MTILNNAFLFLPLIRGKPVLRRMRKMEDRRTCAHLLLGEPQNCTSLLNNHQQENVGSHQKRYPTFKGKGEAPTRW